MISESNDESDTDVEYSSNTNDGSVSQQACGVSNDDSSDDADT